jgi:hypothetical protein
MHTNRIRAITESLEDEEKARMICRLLYLLLQERLGVDLSDETISIELPEDILPARLYGIRCRISPSSHQWIDVRATHYHLGVI